MNFTTKLSPHRRFIYFIKQREIARVNKDLIGGSGPFSDDEIISKYKFCNVNREHDRVTQFVRNNVRNRYAGYPRPFFIAQILTARIFNEPNTLAQILPVNDVGKTVTRLKQMKEEGAKLLRGAYMMPVHGTEGKGKSVEDYYMAAVDEVLNMVFTDCNTLQSVAEKLLPIMGLGDFLCNQVVTDLRYTAEWQGASDWETFVLCGPGSRRGIDRFNGEDPSIDEIGTKSQAYYGTQILEIRESLKVYQMPNEIQSYFRDPNNLSNCFCEFDKFERALWGESNNIRKYTPTT